MVIHVDFSTGLIERSEAQERAHVRRVLMTEFDLALEVYGCPHAAHAACVAQLCGDGGVVADAMGDEVCARLAGAGGAS